MLKLTLLAIGLVACSAINSDFFPIPAGRPRIFIPGCYVPALDLTISHGADLPSDCAPGTYTLGTQGWPDNLSQLSAKCQALSIPIASKPVTRGVSWAPHAQGTKAAVKDDVGRRAYWAALEGRGYTIGENFLIFSYNFHYPPYLICQYSPQTCEGLKTMVIQLKANTGSSDVDLEEHSCGPAYTAFILAYLEQKYPGWVKANIAHEDKLSDDTKGETDIPLFVLPSSNWGAFIVNDSFWDHYLLNNNWVLAAFSPNLITFGNLQIASTPHRGNITINKLADIMPEYQLAGFSALWRAAAPLMNYIFHYVSTVWLFPTNGAERDFSDFYGEDLNSASYSAGYGPGDDEQNTATNILGAVAASQYINTLDPNFSVGYQSFANISLVSGLGDHHIAQLSDPYSLNFRMNRAHTPADY